MVFLRTVPAFETARPLNGDGVSLRAPQLQDYPAWAELRALSREHLVPWEPIWPRDDLTRSAFRRRLRHYGREARDDHGYAFFVFENATGRLTGGVTLSSIRRGVTQSATLGYWMGAPFARRGVPPFFAQQVECDGKQPGPRIGWRSGHSARERFLCELLRTTTVARATREHPHERLMVFAKQCAEIQSHDRCGPHAPRKSFASCITSLPASVAWPVR